MITLKVQTAYVHLKNMDHGLHISFVLFFFNLNERFYLNERKKGGREGTFLHQNKHDRI